MKSRLRKLLDVPSVLTLWALLAISLALTCASALIGSPRLIWLAITTLLLILLNALNHIRIGARIGSLQGKGVRRRTRDTEK